jgi:hypothetical protein
MALHVNNPELQAKIDQWVMETRRPANELVEDAIAGYLDELAQVRKTLDGRYDDIQSGKDWSHSPAKVIAAPTLAAILRSRESES